MAEGLWYVTITAKYSVTGTDAITVGTSAQKAELELTESSRMKMALCISGNVKSFRNIDMVGTERSVNKLQQLLKKQGYIVEYKEVNVNNLG